MNATFTCGKSYTNVKSIRTYTLYALISLVFEQMPVLNSVVKTAFLVQHVYIIRMYVLMYVHKWQYLIVMERVLIAKLCFRIGSSQRQRTRTCEGLPPCEHESVNLTNQKKGGFTLRLDAWPGRLNLLILVSSFFFFLKSQTDLKYL